MTKIGVGCGNDRDAFNAGKQMMQSALQAAGIDHADIVLAFCAGTLDYDRFFHGLKDVVGRETPVIGGATIGIVTNTHLSYKGFPAAVAAIQSDTIRFRVAATGGIDEGEASAGERLAGALPLSEQDRLLLIFYDSVRVAATSDAPPLLNSSAPLLAGLERGLYGGIPIVGAGLLGDYAFNPTRQFCGDRVEKQHVTGCMVSGAVSVYHTIMHGCVPLDGVYHRITKLEGSVLYELGGKPIIPLINEFFGNTNWQSERPVNYLTIGINYGERYGMPQESNYVNRLITGVTPDGKGIGMFEPDLAPGVEIQFMIRDNSAMFNSVKANSASIIERIKHDGKAPIFTFYIDCAGRTAEQSYTDKEEAAEVQKILNRAQIPLLGFYSGVEIAPLLGRSRGLDWTAVLLIFAEDR